jgi:epoxyqueuosine reductase
MTAPQTTSTIGAAIRTEARRLGFDLVGITDVRASDHAAFYRAWIAAGRHGSMSYLAREDAVAARLDAREAFGGLRSAIVVGLGYFSEAEAEAKAEAKAGDGAVAGVGGAGASRGVIARYARGRDYHKILKRKLLVLLDSVEAMAGHELPRARAYVDTGPVLERELARRAGLGWFGRSTMLINPRRGSYFFLGTLLTELELEPDAPFEADHCGTCNACVDACPTGALLGRDASGAPVIDARRCISYLTIENRGPIPRELRPLMGNRVFGCDICQEVCPFSRKFSVPSSEPSFAARGPGEPPVGVEPLLSDGWHPGTDAPSLVDLMSMDESGWEAFSRGSPVRRAGRAGFRRNVAVALGNWGDEAAVPPLRSGLSDSDPLVRSHSAWALGRVGSVSAVAALENSLSAETDHDVIVEIREALAAASSASAPERGVPAR